MLGVYLQCNNESFEMKNQTTVGRAANNVIQIPQNTVSKYHANILCLKQNNQTYLTDLNSVNGTFVNGERIQPQQKISLKHNDAIQFGRSQKLFIFKWKNPPPIGKRINLKDYYFDTESQNHQKHSPVKQKVQNLLFQPNFQQKKYSQVQKNRSQHKPMPKQSKIKIPDISQFLRVKNLDNDRSESPFSEAKRMPQRDRSKQRQKNQSSIKKKTGQNRINFNTLSNFFNENTDQLQGNRKMNLYLQQQQNKKRQEQAQKRRKQQLIRLQLQKARQQQLLLKKQLQMEKKLKLEQQKINMQRKRVQQQMILRAKQRQQQQRKTKEQLLKKQQIFVQKMHQQKQREIEQLKALEQEERKKYQNSLQNDYQHKKQQLQLQAEALARQYQSIYRQTIQKVRNDIKREQQRIQKSQQNIESLVKEIHKVKSECEDKEILLESLKKNYLTINSKNKALILYASEIQNKIDNLKEGFSRQGKKQYSSANAVKLKTRFKQLKDSISHSRKLLKIKNHQAHELENEIKTRKVSIMSGSGFSQKVQDYLQSVIQNSEQITLLKEQYYECMEQQKAIESVWQSQLGDHDQLNQHQKSIQIELTNNVKNIEDSSRDSVRKLCQQRLHMLKCIQTVISDDKRKAAKYLIEQMVELHQQILQFTVQNQTIHLKIGNIICESEVLREQSAYLSQLLFGQGSIHHLDNMKVIINQLMDSIGKYKDTGSLGNCIKLGNDILRMQREIQFEIDRHRIIKQEQSEYMHNANKIIKIGDKSPLNFFGQVLLKKDTQIDNRAQTIKSSKNQLSKLSEQIRILQQKKSRIAFSFQKYKRTQIQQARSWIK